MAEIAEFNAKHGIFSTTSSQDNDWSFVFFPKPISGVLQCLKYKGKEAGNDPESPKYKPLTVMIGDDAVIAGGGQTQLASVTYKSGDGSVQVRVYYIDEEKRLKELCSSIGSDGLTRWSTGSLDTSAFNADPKSPLSASVDQNFTQQLKIYYCRTDDSGLWCAWVHLDSQSWSTRRIT